MYNNNNNNLKIKIENSLEYFGTCYYSTCNFENKNKYLTLEF
jgi:hypothetical protein